MINAAALTIIGSVAGILLVAVVAFGLWVAVGEFLDLLEEVGE